MAENKFENEDRKSFKQLMDESLEDESNIEMKNEYCRENGISMIRIPYTIRKSEQLLEPLRDAIKNRKPGKIALLGNYPKAGWNA